MPMIDSLLKTNLESLEEYFCKYKLRLNMIDKRNSQELNECKLLLKTIKTVCAGIESLTKEVKLTISKTRENKISKQDKQQLSEKTVEKNEKIAEKTEKSDKKPLPKPECLIINKNLFKNTPKQKFEISKENLSMNIRLIHENIKPMEFADYKKLLNFTIDNLSVMSFKINNMINNKDLFENNLVLIWKLIKNPDSLLVFSESQLIVGKPQIIPYKYPKKGDFIKKLKGDMEELNTKKGRFYFESMIVQNEVNRILKKVRQSSLKNFNSKENSDKEEKKTFFGLKTMIKTKLTLYKISFLCSVILSHMETESFNLTKLRENTVIKLSDFEKRPLQIEFLMEWEKEILN